jgi:hypothetical protein
MFQMSWRAGLFRYQTTPDYGDERIKSVIYYGLVTAIPAPR